LTSHPSKRKRKNTRFRRKKKSKLDDDVDDNVMVETIEDKPLRSVKYSCIV